MDLRDAFARCLASDFDRAALADLRQGFADTEQWDETFLLGRYLQGGAGVWIMTIPQSLFVGRRAWVSPTVPSEAAVGDIWYDTRENVAAVLTPAESFPWMVNPTMTPYDPFRSWLSIKPVRNWQFEAWRSMRGSKAGGDGQATSDSEAGSDLLGPPPIEPVRGVTLDEARAYAEHFGKHVADHLDWQTAGELLSETLLDEVWGEQEAEWSGLRSYVDEDFGLAVTRHTLNEDPDEAFESFDRRDGPSPIGRTAFPAGASPHFVGFRTAAAPVPPSGMVTHPADSAP